MPCSREEINVQRAHVAGGEPGDKISQRARGVGRFLQYLFRRVRSMSGRAWVRGGLSGLTFFRPVPHPRCRHGLDLAKPDEFVGQARRAQECLEWYMQWVQLLTRLHSGRTPLVLDLFCCSGGSTEGVRRMHGDVVGVDSEPQPAYVARFGT